MSTISFTSIAHSFSYALLYSLWQGAFIFCLLFVLLKAMPSLNARIKHNLSLSSLGMLAIWFADTWESQYSKLKGVTVYITHPIAVGGGVANVVHPYTVNADAPAHFDIFRDYLPLITNYVPIIIAVYCVGLAFMVLRFMVNLAQLRPLATTATELPPAQWVEFVRRWQISLGISRPVKLLLSHKVNVPMMLGALKPVILLPVSVANHLTTEQVEAIIMHELAHIRRHDYLINLVQTLVETMLFFNPFVWLISAVIRREREHCCDDLVLSCAADPMHYAQALTLIEDDRINSLSLAATGNKNQLFNRIKRIMEMKKENIAHRRYSLLLVALVATFFVASMVAFTPSFAQKTKTEKIKEKETEKNGEPQKVTTTRTVTKDDHGKKKVITKTTVKNAEEDEDETNIGNVRVKVLIDGNGKHNGGSAKIVMIDDDNDGKKQMKEVIVANGRNGSAHTVVIDGDKIHKELSRAAQGLNNVNWEAIGDEIEQAIADISDDLHLDKDIRIEIKRDMERARRDIEQSKHDLAQSRRDLEQSKRDMEQSKRDMEQSKRDIERSRAMARAHADHTHARAHAHGSNGNHTEEEMTTDSDDMDAMLNKMDKEGLIDRSEKFKIEKKDGELYINGTRQPQMIRERYSRYLKGKEVTVKGSKDNLNINVNN